MKKIIFGIFAHPDDEAFGPAGTLLQETRSGTDLHLVTLTNGESGTNPDNYENLGEVRLQEWQSAGKLLEARSTHFFGYQDGHMNNLDMIAIGQRIIEYITPLCTTEAQDTEIELMSLDTNGLTGHIDHIVAARAVCYAFYHLQKKDRRFTRVRLYCFSSETLPEKNVDWIYAEPGRTRNEIGEIVDARDLREDIIEVMRTHHSQRNDSDAQIERLGDDLGLDCFLVRV